MKQICSASWIPALSMTVHTAARQILVSWFIMRTVGFSRWIIIALGIAAAKESYAICYVLYFFPPVKVNERVIQDLQGKVKGQVYDDGEQV